MEALPALHQPGRRRTYTRGGDDVLRAETSYKTIIKRFEKSLEATFLKRLRPPKEASAPEKSYKPLKL